MIPIFEGVKPTLGVVLNARRQFLDAFIIDEPERNVDIFV